MYFFLMLLLLEGRDVQPKRQPQNTIVSTLQFRIRVVVL